MTAEVADQITSENKFINTDIVSGFAQPMGDAGTAPDTHWFAADHAFANPTTARCDEQDRGLGWKRTLTFLNQHLR